MRIRPSLPPPSSAWSTMSSDWPASAHSRSWKSASSSRSSFTRACAAALSPSNPGVPRGSMAVEVGPSARRDPEQVAEAHAGLRAVRYWAAERKPKRTVRAAWAGGHQVARERVDPFRRPIGGEAGDAEPRPERVFVAELDAGRRVGVGRNVRPAGVLGPARQLGDVRIVIGMPFDVVAVVDRSEHGARHDVARTRHGERDPAAGSRHPQPFGERGDAVAGEQEGVDGEQDVDRPVVERDVGEVGLDELGLRHLVSGNLEHPLRAVEADDPSPLPERQARARARPGADVQDGLTGAQVGATDDLRGNRDQGRGDRGRVVARGPREGRGAAERHARWRPTKRSMRSIASTISS